MNTPKTYTLGLLALIIVGGAVLGWKQHQELVALRAAALTKDERTDLQKRLRELERLNQDLQGQLAAARTDNSSARLAGGPRPPGDDQGVRVARGAPGPGGRGNPQQQQFEAIRNLISKPEVQALLSVQQKAAMDVRYAELFKKLNLSPEQRAKFESVLVDFQATRLDVMTAAQEQGVSEPSGVRQLLSDAQGELNTNLKSILGDAGFAQYQSYERTMQQRNTVNQLQQQLSYTDTPLTPAQADQLVQILAANPPPRPPAPTAPPGQAGGGRPPGDARAPAPGGGGIDFSAGIGSILGGMMGGEVGGSLAALLRGGPAPAQVAPMTVSPAAVSQAQAILSQPQVAALAQIQQQQQTQQQLQVIVRDAVSATQPPNGGRGPGDRGGGRRGGGG